LTGEKYIMRSFAVHTPYLVRVTKSRIKDDMNGTFNMHG
jgi:hypothetical protein